MAYMTFICEHRNAWDESLSNRITVETENVFIDEVIEDFEDFLRGCGFKFDGKLEIVPQEEKSCGGDCGSCGCGDNTGENVMNWTVDQLSKTITKESIEDANQG